MKQNRNFLVDKNLIFFKYLRKSEQMLQENKGNKFM